MANPFRDKNFLQLIGLAALTGILLAHIRQGAGECPIAAFRKKAPAVIMTPVEVAEPGASATPQPAAAPTADADWSVGWTHGLVKIRREKSSLPTLTPAPVKLTLARNEYESFQLVFIGGAQAARVHVAFSELVHENGKAVLPADAVDVRRVEYVHTAQTRIPSAETGDWPDPLFHVDEIPVAAGQVQPVWVTLGAPDTSLAGRYTGTVIITDDRSKRVEMPIEVRVWDFSLPRTGHLTTAFDFYRGRLERAYREFVPGGLMWENQFDELENLYFLEMLKHRLWPILNVDVFSAFFRTHVEFYRQIGMGAFAIGRYGGSFDNAWPDDEKELAQAMRWYHDAGQFLRGQQLLPEAYVYAFDEPKPDDPRVPKILSLLESADPDLRKLVVMHQSLEPSAYATWLKDADILCLRITSIDPSVAEELRKQGKELWLYVSSPADGYPGLMIDEPALNARVLPWICWKLKASGLLYWCMNFWNGDPYGHPAPFELDQNGNGFLLYPSLQGPVPSLRMAFLRDGIEDYEYLAVLRERLEAAQANADVSPDLRQKAEKLLSIDPSVVESRTRFTQDPQKLLDERRAIASLIEALAADAPASPAQAKP